MSVEKEREAFEAWLKSLNENGRTTYFLGQESTVAWEAWQASANREGYKLVSIQPDNKTIVSIERMVENQIEASGINQDPFRLDGENIYKAMIGAIE